MLAKPLPVKPVWLLSTVPSTPQKPVTFSCNVKVLLPGLLVLELLDTTLLEDDTTDELLETTLELDDTGGTVLPQTVPFTVGTSAGLPVPWKPNSTVWPGCTVEFQFKPVAL